MFDKGRTRAAEARAASSELVVEKIYDEVARQVVDSAVGVESFRRQIEVAQAALEAANDGLKLAQMRREFAVGVVLENIQAEQDLTRARLDYLRAVSEYNKAQYALARAVGRNL